MDDGAMSAASARYPVSLRIHRAGPLAGIAAATTLIWTGAPLLALWVGSRAQTSTQPSMTAVALVLLTLGVTCFLLLVTLQRLSSAYDRLVGRRRARGHTPWLRSLSGERVTRGTQMAAVDAPERVLVVSVVLAVLAFEVWFFFLSGSSLPRG